MKQKKWSKTNENQKLKRTNSQGKVKIVGAFKYSLKILSNNYLEEERYL